MVRASEGLRLVPKSGVIEEVLVDPGNGAVLQFDCSQVGANAPDCTRLSAVVVDATKGTSAPLTVTNPTAAAATVVVSPGATGDVTVRIGDDGAEPTLSLTSSRGKVAAVADPTVVRRREVECAATAGLAGRYSGNTAEVVVATDGFVISRPPVPVDENDLVVVDVVGDPDVLETVKVVRTSAVREVGQFRVVGGEAVGQIRRQAFEDCGVARAELADFGPGEGVFQITATSPDTHESASANVSFRVNPVYSGAFSFGPVLTGLRDRSYALLADSTVAEESGGGTEGTYVLAYTHFLHGPIDLEKTRSVGLNPMIGVSVKQPLESVYGGLSLDVSRGAAYLMIGVNGRAVTRLANRDDIAVGQRLPQGLTTIPTRNVWRWAAFGGVGVDLRAAIGLFGKVLTGD